MEQPNTENNELQMRISISAIPAVSFIKQAHAAALLSAVPATEAGSGFSIHLEGALQYHSLSRVLNGYLTGRRFEVSEGVINKHVIVEQVRISANGNGNLLIRAQFGGSFNGVVFLTGAPAYDAPSQTLRVLGLRYELQSKSFLLNTAKWLFDSKIKSELAKRTFFPLTPYFDTMRTTLDAWLNKGWTKGIRGTGQVSDLQLEEVRALPEHLLIKSRCNGSLVVQISDINL